MPMMGTSGWKNIRHFKPSEFTDPEQMDEDLVKLLDKARALAGVPFHITSSVRRDDPDSEHYYGRAVDIRAHSSWMRFKVVQSLMAVGIDRIGVYDRHVHAGVSRTPAFPSDVLWTGVSK